VEGSESPDLRFYLGIYEEGLRKTTKDLSQNSRSLDLDLNPGFPEYQAGVPITRPRSFVKSQINEDLTIRLTMAEYRSKQPRISMA
jgi:hypothetical protein